MKLIKSEKGMTVVEILVALAILGLVSVGLMGFFTNSFKFQARNQQTVIAQRLADEALEELKNSRGIITDLKGVEQDITDFPVGSPKTIELKDDHRTTITINKISTIDGEDNTGVVLYDVTLEMISMLNSSIVGTVNTTIRVNSADVNGSGGEDPDSLTLKYDKNTTDEVTNMPKDQTFSKAGEYPISLSSPRRSEYNFAGWAETASSTVAQYNPGDYIELDYDTTTLYAVWKKQVPSYTLTYNANEGSGAPASKTLESGTSVTLSSIKPTRAGWTFMGWAKNNTEASEEQYTSGQTNAFTLTSDTQLDAVWAVTIKFNIPDGCYWANNAAKNAYNKTFYEHGGTSLPYTLKYNDVPLVYNSYDLNNAYEWNIYDANSPTTLIQYWNAPSVEISKSCIFFPGRDIADYVPETTYTVKFYNCPSCTTAFVQYGDVGVGQDRVIPDISTCSHVGGKNFAGYYTKTGTSSGTRYYPTNVSSNSLQVNSDMDLYGVWQ